MRLLWQTFTAAALLGSAALSMAQTTDAMKFNLRTRVETAAGSGRHHTHVERGVAWQPTQTALIVCDMWDAHHCLNAVRRVGELVPRMNQVLTTARRQGALIIHAPSNCMAAFETHPGRQRARQAPTAANLPKGIGQWCRHVPSEDRGPYPIDQRQGGEDDDPFEHRQWHEHLASIGRNPKSPWQTQVAGLEIDEARDAISDSGVEIWNLLEQRGIRNVILLGVHTNMCVLGRPFGLRQLAQHGKNVVLMRDMTDTMYDPAQWPYVSHFTGTDRIVEHIEKYICPTIASGDILGDGRTFRFAEDRRPHLVLLVAEEGYQTAETLPRFAAQYLGRDYRVSFVYGSETNQHDLPGIEVLDEADAVMVSVRRRTLPAEQLAHVRRFVAAGKPVIGIRTASHAFAPPHTVPTDPALAAWDDFDRQVVGGSYGGDHGAGHQPRVSLAPGGEQHPLLSGVSLGTFMSTGTLYKMGPLVPGAQPLLVGTASGVPDEPVAWTFIRADGGRSFYTSLGHAGEFSQDAFCRLLFQGINWACGIRGTPPAPHWTPEMPQPAAASQ